MMLGTSLCLFALGCATTTKNIEGDDGSSFAAAVRVRFPRKPASAPAVAPTDPASAPLPTPLEQGSEFWLDIVDASGRDAQDLAAGQQIQFGDALFIGPERVASELQLREFSLSIAPIGRLDESVWVAASIGLTLLQRELRLRTPSQSFDDRAQMFGLAYGLELDVRKPDAHPLFYGRFHGALAFGSGSAVEERVLELGLGWRFHEHASLRLGLRYWKWIESTNSGSDIDYALSGPVLALDFRW